MRVLIDTNVLISAALSVGGGGGGGGPGGGL